MFKFEMHVHTAENDKVVHLSAPEIVRAYKESGYTGMVITNHFFSLSSEWFKEELDGCDHRGIIDFYLRGFRAAKEEGDRLGMKIFMGIELRFNETANDYLIYGIDENFLYEAPLLYTLDLDRVLEIMPENALIYQAHPFRDGMTVTPPEKLFGIEVHNGGTADERNRFAELWADTYSLHKISGSDFHRPKNLANGGLIFDSDIGDIRELVNELKADRYTLIKNPTGK